ncbi:auxin-responsive protein SAUR36-like [Corylus avellana]|uniref:auxin-responsive protein SAUR36-like n=1 Tax=Corylus avellana TaxID=13451 RepID=UPI001E21191F|nr:auxin-responsive protein SAUR36-like [Corylus avellana]
MRKIRGIRLGRKVVKVFKWIIRPRRNPTRYRHLDPPTSTRTSLNPISKILGLARCLRRGAKGLCIPSPHPDYIRVGQDPVEARKQAEGVPKGHLAVYVGNSDDDTQRYLVPVIYFNHPLFGELLQESEKLYGFNHPGRITIPCGVSEFERVQTRIAAAGEHGPHPRWRRPRQ